jgi:hypothetical protein
MMGLLRPTVSVWIDSSMAEPVHDAKKNCRLVAQVTMLDPSKRMRRSTK